MNKILFIDDESEILKGYRSIFEMDSKKDKFLELAKDFLEDEDDDFNSYFDNLSVITASQGIEGVELFKHHMDSSNPIKIVFIDMRMPPGIDGKETARRIRSLDPKVEIVIATAYSETNLKDVIEEVGSPDKLLYLKKPFDLQEVKQIVLNLIVKSKNERIKDDFISNISHELKTPLSSIIGFSQLLNQDQQLNDESKEYSSIILHSATLLNNLVEELVCAVEFKNNGVVLIDKKVAIPQLMEKIYKSLKPMFFEKSEISFDYKNSTDEDFFATIDPVRLTQIINNLVHNSFKFTDKGTVKLGLTKGDEYYCISVRDTGRGIDEEFKKDMFKKFSRAKSSSFTVPGLGLGLSLVKDIVDSYSGVIEVMSEDGKGTEFKVFLPYVKINA